MIWVLFALLVLLLVLVVLFGWSLVRALRQLFKKVNDLNTKLDAARRDIRNLS